MFSIGHLKLSNLPAKVCAIGQKTKKALKDFRKTLRFLDQDLYGKWSFSQFSTKYFLEFCLLSKSLYLWNIKADFYKNLSDFEGGGDVPAFSPSRLY